MHRFSAQSDIEIVEVFVEEKSAMKPGRPVFSAMIDKIERDKADGIIAWAPDRLARNSIDGGQIIYLLDRGILRDLKFLTYTFENNSQGKFMLQIMFGQSKYYSDALSENVRRGNRTKVELGWRPNQAPLGYLNDPETKRSIPDPERFPILRRMWDLMLTGSYSPEQIRHIANEQWGFQTRATKRWPGGPMQHSTVYRLFTNCFYAGWILWEGTLHAGKHEPMVSQEEFDKVQSILGRRTKSHTRPRVFTFGGLMRCGSCQRLITAETKTNRYGSKYTYYHCAGRSLAKCPERSITGDLLEIQIANALAGLSVPRELEGWIILRVREQGAELRIANRHRTEALKLRAEALKNKRSALVELRLQRTITDEELNEKLNEIAGEGRKLDEALAQQPLEVDGLIEPLKTMFRFGNACSNSFLAAPDAIKRQIFVLALSNPILTAKKLSVQAAEPFSLIPKNRDLSIMLAFMEAIRKTVGNSSTATALEKMRNLLDQMEGQVGAPRDIQAA